jgi:Copper transport outer membrane protein, MctB
VVAGVTANSGSASPISVLRGSGAASKVSTVDDADLAIGQTVVIQALAAELTGGSPGSYGIASGASAVAPTPAPTASASSSPTTSASSSASSSAKKKTKK